MLTTLRRGVLNLQPVALANSPQPIGQPLADWESFCRTLIATRGELSKVPARAWHPILAKPLDQDRAGDGDFTGVDVLRAIALARLLLPAEIEVWAPVAALGPKLAPLALEFGASTVAS